MRYAFDYAGEVAMEKLNQLIQHKDVEKQITIEIDHSFKN